jgi:hypothetical protein
MSEHSSHPTKCSYCRQPAAWDGAKFEYLEPGTRIHVLCIEVRWGRAVEAQERDRVNAQERNRTCLVCGSHSYTYVSANGFTVKHETLGKDEARHSRCLQ